MVRVKVRIFDESGQNSINGCYFGSSVDTRIHTEFYIGFNPSSIHHPLRYPISIPNILRDNEVPWPRLRVAEVAWQSQPSSSNL